MASSLLILILSTIAVSNEVASAPYGQQAEIARYKFAAAIYKDGIFACSGAILNGRYILTAGHCICGLTAATFRVIVGVDRVTNTSKVDWLSVAAIRCSDRFEKVPYTHAYQHDIGLLKLEKPLVAGCKIGSIRLSLISDSHLLPGCKFITFRENEPARGTISQPTSVHTMDLSLRWVNVNIPSREECRPWTRLLVNEICALNANQNQQNSRPGDSGTPVVCGDELFAVELRGLTRDDMRGAAVLKVANYLEWIGRIVNGPQ